jgi:Phage portal protein
MAGRIRDRLLHAWNAFFAQENDQKPGYYDVGYGSSYRPDRPRWQYASERTIIGSIYNRLGIDIAAIDIRHVRRDADGRYQSDMVSSLQDCLQVEANKDQGARHFRQDCAMTLFDKGVIAIVPVDTTFDPTVTGSYDIQSMRVGEVLMWFPDNVKVRVYNDKLGIKQDILLPKKMVAIIENPLYTVMNEPNSTLQRLIRKLTLLDFVDDQSASGKLDIIIQLPYTLRTETRRTQAEERRKEIEFQLKGSQYGIAYSDATEKIVQLNRPSENNLLGQIEMLIKQLYAELGVTNEIINGTADEAAKIDYYNRTVEPITAAIIEGMRRTFLTKTARSQGQWIMGFRNPFILVPIKDLADIADKFSRNEILAPNEFRGLLGFKPDKDPKSDKLINSNMPQSQPQQSLSSPQDQPQLPQGQFPLSLSPATTPNGKGSQNGT